MTLEERVTKELQKHWGLTSDGIEDWRWPGEPARLEMRGAGSRALICLDSMHRIIQQAPLEIALSSPSHYIREYRKWYEENK